jgi:hypothetical protein
MEPSPQRPHHGQDRRYDDGLSSRTVHDLQGSLTIIKAQAQMLRRWARRQELTDAEVVFTRLAMIDDTATRLSAEIDRLRRPGRSKGSPNGEPLDRP